MFVNKQKYLYSNSMKNSACRVFFGYKKDDSRLLIENFSIFNLFKSRVKKIYLIIRYDDIDFNFDTIRMSFSNFYLIPNQFKKIIYTCLNKLTYDN
jgi:hypothetical protein